jgi:galactokinase/mevalonate kinase-like predicted kinase
LVKPNDGTAEDIGRRCSNIYQLMLLASNPPFSRFYVSFSFTVGLVDARWHSEVNILQKVLALDAVHIEQDILRENVSSLDQICAAFGGLNRINFLESGRFCRLTDRLLRAGARNSERSPYV